MTSRIQWQFVVLLVVISLTSQKAKTAVGMHWGTWRMAHDPIAEPPILLAEARKVVGLTEEQFGVCALGETRYYSR